MSRQPSGQGEKGLKWKKDGTAHEIAKCGFFTATIHTTVSPQDFGATIYTDYGESEKQRCHAYLRPPRSGMRGYHTKELAKRAAETWLRKQAIQMLKDLGAPNE